MINIPESILERASLGHADALEEIYRSSCGFVYSVALRTVRSREDAEEVTQDVFLKVFRHLNSFKGKSAFSTWLYRITVNTAMDRLRKYGRKDSKHVDLEEAEDTAVTLPEAGKNLDQDVHEHTVQNLLSHLSPDQRVCIILREIEGLQYEEIAKTLRININTVRTRLKRAREKLAAIARKKKEVRGHEL